MEEYEQMVARQKRWMHYLIGAFLIGALFTPLKTIFMGLLLGHIVSYYSLRLLHRNITRFGKMAAGEGTTRGLGTFTRLAFTAAAVFIALKFDQEFHIIAVVVGLVTSYIIIFVDVTVRSISNS